jgi:hypothetical protein
LRTPANRKKIRRLFYKVDEHDGNEVVKLGQETFSEHITDTNAKNGD